MNYPIHRKITINQMQKCGLHMSLDYIPSLIQVKNETFKI